MDVENALNLPCIQNITFTTGIREENMIRFLPILLGCEEAPIKNVLQSMSDMPLFSVDIKIPVHHCQQWCWKKYVFLTYHFIEKRHISPQAGVLCIN